MVIGQGSVGREEVPATEKGAGIDGQVAPAPVVEDGWQRKGREGGRWVIRDVTEVRRKDGPMRKGGPVSDVEAEACVRGRAHHDAGGREGGA